MIVLSFTKYATFFIFLDLIESDEGVAALIVNGFSKYTVLIIAAKRVH